MYERACMLLQRQFERTRDPKWCTLRCDLFLRHTAPPMDALGPVILAAENFLLGAPPAPLFKAARDFLRGGVAAAAGPKVKEAMFRACEDTLKEAKKMKEPWKCPPGLAGGKVDRVWEGLGFCKPFCELLVLPAVQEMYKNEVPSPMDLRTMVKKAREGRYGSVEEVRADMALLVANCRKFNTPRESPDGAKALFALADRIAEELRVQLKKHLAAAQAPSAALAAVGGGGGGGGGRRSSGCPAHPCHAPPPCHAAEHGAG